MAAIHSRNVRPGDVIVKAAGLDLAHPVPVLDVARRRRDAFDRRLASFVVIDLGDGPVDVRLGLFVDVADPGDRVVLA